MYPVVCGQTLFPLMVLSVVWLSGLSEAETRQSRRARGALRIGPNSELRRLEITEEELLQDLEDLHRVVKRGTEDLDHLNCPPCERLHCSPKKASKLNCKGEITLGVCNCCPRCAKVTGESCGGKWNYLGRCETGFECVPDGPLGQDVHGTSAGFCRRISVIQDQPDVIELPGCQPKCTPDFCQANPKAICSAQDNADVLQHCQGECQHTSCLACQFVAEEPDCGKCSRDNFRCMRRYAKCLRRSLCSQRRFPCLLKDTADTSGKFQCKVPECTTNL